MRGTLRSLSREAELRAALKKHLDANDRLEVVPADLIQDEGWDKAVAGCEYVLHVASPFPAALPKNDDELIVPAVQGPLRVLKAAAKHGVKRVVLTSSVAAISRGHGDEYRHRGYEDCCK